MPVFTGQAHFTRGFDEWETHRSLHAPRNDAEMSDLMTMKQRLVFGCGYLGARVARLWNKAGDDVFAVTRSDSRQQTLSEEGYSPFLADVTRPETLFNLPQVDTVLIAVGMDRSVYSDIRKVYVEGLKNVLDALPASVQHVIYVSSTGVYGNFDGAWIDEEAKAEPKREGGKACLEAEQLLKQSRWGARATILRFAGIYGPARVPTRQQILDKRWDRLSPFGYLNLIQVDDGASIVQLIAHSVDVDPDNTDTLAQTFLVSDGQPPLRRDYYDWIADRFGVGPIPWEPNAVAPLESRASSSKRISNRKLQQHFSIDFMYPDYRAGLTHALDEQ